MACAMESKRELSAATAGRRTQEMTPKKTRAIKINTPHLSRKKRTFCLSGGRKTERILEPSRGGKGKRLNKASKTLRDRKRRRNLPDLRRGSTSSRPNAIAAPMARSRFIDGPASATMAGPRRRFRRAGGEKGTGLPQPKPTSTTARVPTGSRWRSGFRVRRPASRAVWSPWMSAARA